MEGAFTAIRDVQCDVLVHWTPGADVVNYFLPFLPICRVQCLAFGMHGTTGIPGIDYCISSRLFERGEQAAEDYTERLELFESATSWQERPPAAEPATRADFGLPSSGAIYFCPQRMAKFHPSFDRLMRRILQEDETGHICLLAGKRPRSRGALASRLEVNLGPTLAQRVVFVPWQDPAEYRRLLQLMDAVLDIPTYSSALTGYDALAAGVPIVTLPGRLMVQRYAAGLYRQMGMCDLVAASEDDYVDLALRLGRDAEYRQHMRQKIHDGVDVLFSDRLVIEEYQQFFERVVSLERT
jgi:predicted O-linked N-acetylglucosamine transferase (SPINDLY family)